MANDQSLRTSYVAACQALHNAVEALQAAEARRDAALSEMERLEKAMSISSWRPFDYANPPEGLMWLEVERPETWCDAADDGRTVGGYTGDTQRVVVLASVYMDEEHGVRFDCPLVDDRGDVRSSDRVHRYLLLTPPDLPPEK